MEHLLIQFLYGIIDIAILFGMVYLGILLERKWFPDKHEERHE